MPELNEVMTIRCLPGGDAQPARVATWAADHLSLFPIGGQSAWFRAGTLVEVEGPQALYLGEIVGGPQDSLVTVSVEHFIDRAALAEMEKSWKTAEGA